MEFFRIRRDIPFMRHALVLNVISVITFLAAVFFIATRGLHLSIEFTGGTVIELQYPQAAPLEKVREAVDALKFGEVQVQNFGTSRDVLIRLPVRGDVKQSEVVGRVFDALCAAYLPAVTWEPAARTEARAAALLAGDLAALARDDQVGVIRERLQQLSAVRGDVNARRDEEERQLRRGRDGRREPLHQAVPLTLPGATPSW